MSFEAIMKDYELVCGLEVHAQLKTKTKLMSSAASDSEGAPNNQVSTICTGMPGALPVLNRAAIDMAIKTALALNCELQEWSVFSRKHYFYPDLPKGYQISQYDRPYAKAGRVVFFVRGERREVNLTRIHMEEDAGKNLHFDERGVSLVDLNRSSVPLIEIVSEPEIRHPEEAVSYLKALRLVLRYLDVCEGNLEEGNFRCDANVSIRPRGEKKFGTRVELKNINSFRNLERAIIFEVERQYRLIQDGGKVSQETRLWDADQSKSISMRSKEEASDYRYMPEPDLLPLQVDAKWIKSIRDSIPETPIARMDRFIKDYGRSPYDAEVLTGSSALADYYEKVAKKTGDATLSSNFIQTNMLAKIQNIETGVSSFYPHAEALAELLLKVKDATLSLGLAKEVFEEMLVSQKTAGEIIQAKGLSQVNDEGALLKVIEKVMADNPSQLAELRSGKEKLFGFFMGQCQKALGGKGNPQQLKTLLEGKLKA